MTARKLTLAFAVVVGCGWAVSTHADTSWDELAGPPEVVQGKRCRISTGTAGCNLPGGVMNPVGIATCSNYVKDIDGVTYRSYSPKTHHTWGFYDNPAGGDNGPCTRYPTVVCMTVTFYSKIGCAVDSMFVLDKDIYYINGCNTSTAPGDQ
jgi:hypothetical protein